MRYLDQIREMEKQASAHRDQVKGGLADKKQPKDLPQDQLRMGKKVEREHTKDPSKAKEIAMDHLVEDKRYYTKLHKMEKKAMLGAFVDELEKIAADMKVDENVLRGEMTQLAGQASMAWSPRPSTQVFDPEEALRAVDGTMKRLKEKTARKLTPKVRKKLPAQAFVFQKEKRYPIHDASHARNALARASGKPEEAKVRAAVHRRYPGIGKTAGWLDRKFQEAGKSVATGATGELKQRAKKYIPHAIAAGVAIPTAMGAASYYGSKRGVKAAIREASRPQEQEKTAVSEQWVQSKVLETASKARKPLNLLGREKLQDFADRVMRKGGTMAQRDRRHIAGTTALHVLNSGRTPLKTATIVKTAVSMAWVGDKVRRAEEKAGEFWNTKGRERLGNFQLSNMGSAVWGPKAHRAKREAVSNLVKMPKPNIVDKALPYVPKLAAAKGKAFSSVFRRSKGRHEDVAEDTGEEVKPNLSFFERHPKAIVGGATAAGVAGAGYLLYKNRDAAKRVIGKVRDQFREPPQRVSLADMEKIIDKAFSAGDDLKKPGIDALRPKKAVPPTASPKHTPPVMKTVKSPVTNVEVPLSGKGYGALGEKMMKALHPEAQAGSVKKLNRAERRRLAFAKKE